jgi:hypothetical protein
VSAESSRHRLTPVVASLLVVGSIWGCAPSGSGAVAGAVATPASVVAVVPVATPTPTPSASTTDTPTATATPTPTATPTASPTPTAAPTPSGPIKVNLYGKGDFVSQATKDQCVAGAMQIMLNVVGPENDRRKSTQARLAVLARSLSDARDDGTEPEGWARGLAERGAGDYEVVVEATMGKAVRRGIEAIRATGRPVGLLVWRGAHSWVLHGFETTADPAVTDDYEVAGIWVSDPWFPRISSIWGPSRKPNQRITVKQLREDYLKWRRPTGKYPGKDGKYVLVIPVG